MTANAPCCSRRDVLGLGCGAFVISSLGLMSASARRAFAQDGAGKVVDRQPFAYTEKLADDAWAVIATPQGGYEVVCNGGIIAGRDAVLAIEATMSGDGAAYICAMAEQLAGRPPTHVIMTHYHGDHTAGLYRYVAANPDVVMMTTATTRDLLLGNMDQRLPAPDADGGPFTAGPAAMLPNAVLRTESAPMTIDLGGRTVTVTPRRGHTDSDVTIEISDPRIVWCGDLVFNGLFPNYRDSSPSKLTEVCNDFLRDPGTLYVPGHGPLGDRDAMKPYLGLLEDVENAARKAHKAGKSAAEAGQSYTPDPALGEWAKFNPRVFEWGIDAWYREFNG